MNAKRAKKLRRERRDRQIIEALDHQRPLVEPTLEEFAAALGCTEAEVAEVKDLARFDDEADARELVRDVFGGHPRFTKAHEEAAVQNLMRKGSGEQ